MTDQQNYVMPAEWAPHERTWMAWPCRAEVWGDYFQETKKGYAAVANAIAAFEPVTMLVRPDQEAEARTHLSENVTTVSMNIDDSWTRDSGPNFLSNGKDLKAACFTFNAWGEQYQPYDQDALMAERIADLAGAPVIPSKLVAEGGGITVDGEGTLITTETCFPNANRNPDWSRDEIEEELKKLIGVKKVIWLPGDPYEDETNGHIDGIAMFAAPGKVLIERPGSENCEWAEIQDENLKALTDQTDANGRPIELIEIRDASAAETLSDKFCMSYVNFYICNGAVIAPSYGIAEDQDARSVLSRTFPDREVVMIPIKHIAMGGGGIHCITQQQPKI